MNAAKSCWGIHREVAHSPGRIDDDGAILKSVGEALAERGLQRRACHRRCRRRSVRDPSRQHIRDVRARPSP